MEKVAILFPGQGSQFNQMGADFRVYPEYQAVQAELFTTIPDSKLALNGELDINQTCYAQPILFANQVGILEVVKANFNVDNAVYGGSSHAGHSDSTCVIF